MKLAIVGTSHELNSVELFSAGDVITDCLKRLRPDLVISGGAAGIDTIAVNKAVELGFPTKNYLPNGHDTRHFMMRNKQIAEACDSLLCITTKVKDEMCYHHTRPQNHQKTAGCWTLREVNFMGKPCKLVIV